MANPLLFYCSRVILLMVPILVWVILGQNEQESKEAVPCDSNRAKRSAPPVTSTMPITLFGVSVETDPEVGGAIAFGSDGTTTLLEETTVNLVLFGLFTNLTRIRFSMHESSCGFDSDMEEPLAYDMTLDEEENARYGSVVGRVYDVILPQRSDYPRLYFCLSEDNENWYPQGNSLATHFYLVTPFLPTWIRILFLIFLLGLSGLFSGLSLGLMSLDKTDLSIVSSTGNAQEKKYATKIAPVRNHGNFLLCSLLFSNVLVNASLTLMMDSLMAGAFAVAVSTLAIVIFGEIIPQSVCTRYGLAVGAYTIYITKFFMVLTAPLAWPLSKLLDKVLGEEIGAFYTRERLKELLVVTEEYHGLEPEELALISGALGMKSKTVAHVMTPLSSVFMLSIDSHLDYNTLSEIEYHAYTRIPVFEKERQNIVAILTLKQLAALDAGEKIPFRQIVAHYPTSTEIVTVPQDMPLNQAFRKFRGVNKSHMMIVQGKREPGDAEARTVGIMTMENVLEELLKTKIHDEKDIEKLRARRGKFSTTIPPSFPNKTGGGGGSATISIPPPLAMAAITHLTTTVRAFSRTEISGTVLTRLIKTNLRRAMPHPPGEPGNFIFQAGIMANSFIMILEGNVQVSASFEKIPFTCGPFTCFGSEFLIVGERPKELAAGSQKPVPARNSNEKGFQRLSTHFKRRQTIQLRQMGTVPAKHLPKPPTAFPKYAFTPDYSVLITGETFFVEIDFRTYRAARCATQLAEKHKADPQGAVKQSGWREDVEQTLTLLEADLKYKHRGRFVCTEAEQLDRDDADMTKDVELTTALFLGSVGEKVERETRDVPNKSKWHKLRQRTFSTQGMLDSPQEATSVSLPAAVIELLRARNLRA